MVRSCMLDLWWEETNDNNSSLALNYPVLLLDAADLLEMKLHPFLQWKVSEEMLGQFETITASANGI